ncbi:hypothetical protein [Gemmobacter sp. LW-1]|uniref:hypothetical protein n=1 Tax=Gemmobacter sp. LW-1 TaxID=1529005 RepID=UPI0006C739F1|nr:hypothetical protein [Gemmobacter sp. LW-1]
MRVVEPIAITEAMLVSSNVPETDAAAWNAGTAYAVGNQVIRGHAVYEAVQAHTGQDPLLDAGSTYWLKLGATNRWKAFDRLISDPVVKTGSITYSLQISSLADAVAFFGLNASSVRVKVTDPVDGVIYDVTRTIVDNSAVFDGWSYCFEPVVYDTQEIVTGVPIYSGVTLDITVTSGSATQVGQIVVGRDQILGEALVDTAIGIEDFSRKERDDFGNAIIIERAYAQTASFRFAFPTEDARRIRGILARLRATPAVYYAGPSTSQYGTTVYGFFRDFSIPLTTNRSFGNLEVEGLT